jgi:hypothetical protein
MENIKHNELKAYRDVAKMYLGYSDSQMTELVNDRVLVEIVRPPKGGQNG